MSTYVISKRQKARGNGKTSKAINYYLDEVKADLVQIYRDLKSESKTVTPQRVKARFLGGDNKIQSLKDIFKYHNEKMGVKLAPKTVYHYKTSQKYILAYITNEYRADNMYLRDLNYSFTIGFKSFYIEQKCSKKN